VGRRSIGLVQAHTEKAPTTTGQLPVPAMLAAFFPASQQKIHQQPLRPALIADESPPPGAVAKGNCSKQA